MPIHYVSFGIVTYIVPETHQTGRLPRVRVWVTMARPCTNYKRYLLSSGYHGLSKNLHFLFQNKIDIWLTSACTPVVTRKPNLDKSVFITVVVFFRDIFSKENCLTRSKKPEGIVLNKWRGTGSLFLDKVRRSGDEATRLSSVRGVFIGGWRLEELRKVSERWAMCWHWQGQFSPRQSDSSDGGKNGRRLDYYSRVWFRVKSW